MSASTAPPLPPSGTTRALLSVENVSMRFGGLMALSGVTMDLRERELVSIIGPNGSGKTTLFNLITGIYRPARGRMTFDGRTLDGLPPEKVARLGIARTFQNIRLFATLTALENVLVGTYCHGDPRAWAQVFGRRSGWMRDRELRDRACECLSFVGLDARKEELACNLPYGDQKRLEIARALGVQSRLLLLDEPVAGLNQAERGAVIRLIDRIRSSGVTVLLIEHDMRVVMNVSERIVVLNYGQKIAEGAPADIRANHAVAEAYLGTAEDPLA